MAWLHIENVYKCVRNTTGTQQAVLVAIAYHKNKDTGRCDPGYECLARETRFTVRTVANAIKALKRLGLLDWKSGGWTKSGDPMANKYILTLPPLPPPPPPKGKPKDVDSDADTPVDNSAGADGSMHLTTAPVCTSLQDQYASDGNTSMNEVHTNLKPTSNEPQPNQRVGGGFSSSGGGGERKGGPQQVAASIGNAFSALMKETGMEEEPPKPQTQRQGKISLRQMAMDACDLTIEDKAVVNALVGEIRRHDLRLCYDIIIEFQNTPKHWMKSKVAVLMSRLQKLPRLDDSATPPAGS